MAEPLISTTGTPISNTRKPARRVNFTNKERRLLLDDYDDIVNIREDKTIDAWEAWAAAVSITRHVLDPVAVLKQKTYISIRAILPKNGEITL